MTSIFRKKGDRKKCVNYRKINIILIIGRLHVKVIKNRIEENIKYKKESKMEHSHL